MIINGITYFISPIISTAILFSFLRQMLENTMRRRTVLLLSFAVNLLAIPRMIYGFGSRPATICIAINSVIAFFIIPLTFFRGKWWKRLLLNLYMWTLLMLCDLLFSAYFLPRLGLNFLLWPPRMILIYEVLAILLFFLLGSFSLLFLRQISARKFQPFYLLYLLFPLSLWMMAYGHLLESVRWLWLPGVILAIGAQIALLTYTIAQERRSALEQELKDIRRITELEQAHYRLVDLRQEELAHICHDFNNQLAAIKQLIRAEEEADAQRMIGKLADDIRQTTGHTYCNIPVINAVLEEKASLCRSKGIDLDIKLEFPAPCCIEPLQLCSVFSNLLDNAIHGAEGSGEARPWLHLRSKVDGDYLFIRTQNPSATPTEKPPPGHGYGSKILSRLAEQYGGSYRTEFQSGLYQAVLSLAVK